MSRQWAVAVLKCTLVNYVKLLAHWHGLLSDVIASLTELCATENLTVATLGQLHVLALVTYMWYILSHIPCGDILKVQSNGCVQLSDVMSFRISW